MGQNVILPQSDIYVRRTNEGGKGEGEYAYHACLPVFWQLLPEEPSAGQ